MYAEEIIAPVMPVNRRKGLDKKMGVWVDGKLKLQSRDRAAIDAYAEKRMDEQHSVWVAPIGSFVTV